MAERKTSQIIKILKTKNGSSCTWWGIGWRDFDKDLIIVTNGFFRRTIKRSDFIKVETMAELNAKFIIDF